jgi:hypothetical protein
MSESSWVSVTGGVDDHVQDNSVRDLRRRYRRDHDLISLHGLARLRFMRWLYRIGYINGCLMVGDEHGGSGC